MPERPDEVARRIVREELTDAYNDLGVGLPGTKDRRDWLEIQRRVTERIKRLDARKERRTVAMAGIGYGIIGTAVAGGITWMTGTFQWLLSSFTAPR